ncbi:alpha/beta fold hydrolase [Tabrizicola thermarum]|uniref:alpha/beta fold hydrolase n=1 Tax=Tabrizicola thermarum TaxID=2670345 RepID=UPI000FFC3638|nr:alpha/beta hydrolase [Tabrizicola thermarum]
MRPSAGHAVTPRPWLVLSAAVMLAACAPRPEAAKPPLYTAREVAAPEEITFLLPGALTTARIFGPANDWTTDRHLVVEYRLPGMRGEPLSPPLDILRAADWVAGFANRHPQARINLLGYSTGAAIAIEAAGRIDDSQRVRVVAISSATPFPGAAMGLVNGVAGIVGSALATGSLDAKTVWEDYFITLYIGSGWRSSPEKRAMAERLRRAFAGQINTPGEGRGRSQSASLLLWTLSREALASRARITFFHGQNDPIFPLPRVRRLATRLNATLCVLPEDGHMPLLSRPDLMERVERVLAGTGGPCG